MNESIDLISGLQVGECDKMHAQVIERSQNISEAWKLNLTKQTAGHGG